MSDRIIVLSMAPGRIKAVVDIPMELREPLPFQSREVPLFREYFLKVWKEIEE
jgi:NitT/TauT family transport system ATP-binding protein